MVEGGTEIELGRDRIEFGKEPVVRGKVPMLWNMGLGLQLAVFIFKRLV